MSIQMRVCVCFVCLSVMFFEANRLHHCFYPISWSANRASAEWRFDFLSGETVGMDEEEFEERNTGWKEEGWCGTDLWKEKVKSCAWRSQALLRRGSQAATGRGRDWFKCARIFRRSSSREAPEISDVAEMGGLSIFRHPCLGVWETVEKGRQVVSVGWGWMMRRRDGCAPLPLRWVHMDSKANTRKGNDLGNKCAHTAETRP